MAEWNKLGIPHKGWKCIDVLDLGENTEKIEEIEYEQCEMCGNEKIRYVHVMEHPEYPETLHVGCVCAEKMSGDYDNPRKLENLLKNKANRRRNFNRIEWKFNPSRKSYSKKYKGEYITIVESKYGNFGVFFANQKIWEYDGQKISSFEFAESVAFEIFEKYHTTREERTLISLLKSQN